MTHELRQVRAFLKVAELQSFTRAAGELHVSQSALTVQVKQLEEELGVLLLDRNKRGVTITAAGRDLLGPLERLVAEAEAIAGYARDISAVRTGAVAIAALPTIAAGILPGALRRFARQHPEIRFSVQDVVADRVRQLVSGRSVDLGLGTPAEHDRELKATPLYQDSLAAFVGMDHPLAKRKELNLHDVLRYELILPNRESSVRRIVEAAIARERASANIRYETNFMPTALAMARSGLGAAILPESAAGLNVAGLMRIPFIKPVLHRQICLLERRDRSLSPSAAAFVECLRAHVETRGFSK
jgi:LysR family transcriptional regulator, carnitine catabolism transcriptional activator